MDEIEQRTAEIVRLGLARAEQLEARAAWMRALLADPEFVRARAEATAGRREGRHAWELPENDIAGARRMWAARVFDIETNHGLATRWYAAFAHSEAEFRRTFAHRVGREFANSAVLDDWLHKLLERRHGQVSKSCMQSLFIEHHSNYS